MSTRALILVIMMLLPVIAVLVLLIWKNAPKKKAATIAIISESCVAIIALYLFITMEQATPGLLVMLPWMPNLQIGFNLDFNALSFIFLLVEVLVTLAAMIYSLGEEDGSKQSNFYYALLLLFSLGMSGTTLAEDMFLFYVFWELMLVASVLLILIWGHGENRFRIALKYFIFTHLGSLLVLVCLITLYVNTGTASLTALAAQAQTLPDQMQGFLILFFLLGFCIKMAIFPLHIWLPDAHTVAPMPVTIILAAAMLAMGTYGILRFPVALFTLEKMQPFAIWMMIAGVVSEIYGALMAFAEKDIKRIIAYSSVSQMGYILFGLGSLTAQGMMGAVMHVIYHAIVKAMLFMVVGMVIKQTRERQIENLGGLGAKMPLLAVCAAIGVLAISGMPPLGIFNSEWMIFTGGFAAGIPLVLPIISLVSSIFTLVYALRFFIKVFFGALKPQALVLQPMNGLMIPTIAVTVLLLVEGFIPGPLMNWVTQGLAAIMGGF